MALIHQNEKLISTPHGAINASKQNNDKILKRVE